MKRKSSHDSLTAKELAEMILSLIEKGDKDMENNWCVYIEKIEKVCQDVVDEW